MIGVSTRSDRAAAVIARMAARQGGNEISLLPPIGTGGTYDEDAMDTVEVAYVPVGPLPAALRNVREDEIQQGLGSGWWLAGDSLPTGTATIAVQAGLDSDWRIVIGGEERPIRAVDTHDSFQKVFYA